MDRGWSHCLWGLPTLSRAVIGQFMVYPFFDDDAEAEVCQFYQPWNRGIILLENKNVRWLQITVDDLTLTKAVQTGGDIKTYLVLDMHSDMARSVCCGALK